MNEEYPYQPPKSDVGAGEDLDRRGSPLKGVALGAVVDIAGTVFFGLILGVAYGIYLATSGLSPEELQAAALQVNENWVMMALSTGIGAVFSVLGGYICASIINYSEYKYAAILAVVVVIIGKVMSAGSALSIAQHLSLIAITIGCIYLGAFLHVKAKRRRMHQRSA